MRTLVVLLASLLLAGCSGDGAAPAPAPPAHVGTTLEQTCPEAGRALQRVDATSAASLHTAALRVRELAAAGDTETKDALAPVVRGLRMPGHLNATLGRLASACADAGAPIFH